MSQIDSPSLSHVQLPMVSHAEVSAPSRRASSVASRSRSRQSQQHHRGRSHHGGISYAPQNEFPFFTQSGDVEVVIACDGQEKRYLLHRLILAQFSGFFHAGMSDEWSRNHTLAAPSPRPDQALSIINESDYEVSIAPPALAAEQIQSQSGRRRWRYELDWVDLEEDEEPMLIQKPPSPGGIFTSSFQPPAPQPRPRPPASHGSFFRSMANLALTNQSTAPTPADPVDPAAKNPLIRDYDNLFRIFYSYEPVLNSLNIASAYSECKALLSIADIYDALPVVGPRIDHHLLRFSSRLFKQIAKYPPSYLKLGYLARSRIIFSEAVTHVVGQWPAAYPYLKTPNQAGGGYEVPQSVIDLIEDKVEEMEELKSKIEAKLFRLTLTTSRGERVNPSNDYLGWLAMSLFRQWVAENTTPEVRGILKNVPASRPGSGNNNTTTGPGQAPVRPSQNAPLPPPPPITASRIYRLIASPNAQAYLPHEELKRFLRCHPSSSPATSLYSRDNLKRFERKMDEIKNVARDLVKPLTRNCLELDLRLLDSSGTGGGGLGYLTCMKVEEDEIPWD
jgi:hypothetical protein